MIIQVTCESCGKKHLPKDSILVWKVGWFCSKRGCLVTAEKKRQEVASREEIAKEKFKRKAQEVRSLRELSSLRVLEPEPSTPE